MGHQKRGNACSEIAAGIFHFFDSVTVEKKQNHPDRSAGQTTKRLDSGMRACMPAEGTSTKKDRFF